MLLLLACATPCEFGTRRDDGNCYVFVESDTTGDPADDTAEPTDTGDPTDTDTEPGPSSWEDALLAALEGECVAMEPGDRLDVQNGCIDGACVGMTTAEIEAAIGPPNECWSGDDLVQCRWGESSEISAELADLDQDGAPDPDAVLDRWLLYAPYPGADADGLGIAADLACFVEILGSPDTVTWQWGAYGDYFLYGLAWRHPDVEVLDFTDVGWVNMSSPDGLPDMLYLGGP